MKQIEGNLFTNEVMRVGIVVSRFNDFLTQNLLKGCEDGLRRSGVNSDAIDVVWVPGAYEIPLATKLMAKTNNYDALITLGAVIRGATSHYDLVINQSSTGISQVAYDYELPVIFGILTVETIEQGIERAGTKAGNLGFTYGTNAVEMVNMLRKIT